MRHKVQLFSLNKIIGKSEGPYSTQGKLKTSSVGKYGRYRIMIDFFFFNYNKTSSQIIAIKALVHPKKIAIPEEFHKACE